MPLPDYQGGSIANLMTSVIEALGGERAAPYPPLHGIDTRAWRASRTLVLCVIDGLGYEQVRRHDGALAAHLQARLTSVFPSTTATAIPTLLTGRAPQQQALTGWHMYLRELGGIVAVLPFTARAGGAALGKGIDVGALLGAQSLATQLPVRMHVVSPRRIVHSDFNVAFTNGAERHGYETLTEMFEAVARLARRHGSARQYVYAYWPGFDGLAHQHGVASPAVQNHLAEIDAAFAAFLQRLAGTDTTVIATADHGIIDSTPEHLIELAAHPRLERMLVLPLCGERRVAYCYVQPQQSGAFERYVHEELASYAECHASAQLIERGFFGLGEPHPRLAERIGHYTLSMKDNYAIKDWLVGERRHAHVGLHGGLSDAEMYVPLAAASV